jgi:hypothetical protein
MPSVVILFAFSGNVMPHDDEGLAVEGHGCSCVLDILSGSDAIPGRSSFDSFCHTSKSSYAYDCLRHAAEVQRGADISVSVMEFSELFF